MAEKILKKPQCFYIDNKKINKYKVKKKSKAIILGLMKVVLLIGFCFIILYPVLMMLSKAFMDRMDLYDQSVILVPKHFTLENFKIASKLLYYPEALTNSLLLAAATTVLQIASCLMAGYAFGRYESKLKNILFGVVILTVIIPPQLITLPMFMQFKFFDPFGLISLFGGEPLNLIDSPFPFLFLSVTANACKNGIFIFMFRQFFKNMPMQIEEAALVDGAGHFGTFLKIMLPNAVTPIVTVGLFSFVWQYNDVVYSSIFLQGTKVLPMLYRNLERFTAEVLEMLNMTANDAMSMAYYVPITKSTGVLMMMTPIILVFLIFQRYFVESIERSGLTGM